MPLVLDSSLTRYAIRTSSGKTLDVAGGAIPDRSPVVQWDDHGAPNQRFYLDLCGDGVYRIIAVHSGRVLDLSGPDGQGAPIWTFAWAAVDNQRWKLDQQKDGTVEVASVWDSSLVLDVEKSSKDNGARIIVWKRHGGANQRFRLVAA